MDSKKTLLTMLQYVRSRTKLQLQLLRNAVPTYHYAPNKTPYIRRIPIAKQRKHCTLESTRNLADDTTL